jgi:nitrogen fixation/metabolism regulation signal transduction histidine kinase
MPEWIYKNSRRMLKMKAFRRCQPSVYSELRHLTLVPALRGTWSNIWKTIHFRIKIIKTRMREEEEEEEEESEEGTITELSRLTPLITALRRGAWSEVRIHIHFCIKIIKTCTRK